LKTWHNDKKTMTRNKKTIMGLALALALMAVLSLFVGAVPLAPADVLTTLFGGETSDTLRFIVLESRLPQTLTAALCGLLWLSADCFFRTFFAIRLLTHRSLA